VPSSDHKPDTIQVSVTQERERAAIGADLSVTVEGTSLVTGEMALRKAREVAQLVSALQEVGIDAKDITLQGVRADTSGGKVIKMSAARYSLRVRCEALDMLADVLGAITSQKNVTLNGISWRYREDNGGDEQWLDDCLAEANRKARRIANALGVRLLGVRSCLEEYREYGDEGRQWHVDTLSASAQPAMRRARVSAEELGLEVSHTKRVELSVRVEYRISGFAEDA